MMTKNNLIKARTSSALETEIRLRQPLPTDGAALHRLIAECPPLDANSLYCNLLHCTHFATTSVAAELDGQLVGFVSGYLVPSTPQTVFVWQVAVSPLVRKRGLAQRMLHELLQRPACRDAEFLHTSVTPDNHASKALFSSLARDLSCAIQESIWFDSTRHFAGAHADEILLQIGQLPPRATRMAIQPVTASH
jgi:L-2,4-diaminobutyric acid acetyltransferase